jgi:hypothetical protein
MEVKTTYMPMSNFLDIKQSVKKGNDYYWLLIINEMNSGSKY